MSPKQQTCTISHICITVLWDNYCFHLKKKNLYSENQEVFPKKKKKRKTQEGNREETEQKTITEGKVRPVLLL